MPGVREEIIVATVSTIVVRQDDSQTMDKVRVLVKGWVAGVVYANHKWILPPPLFTKDGAFVHRAFSNTNMVAIDLFGN
jgi:hypothetical protein